MVVLPAPEGAARIIYFRSFGIVIKLRLKAQVRLKAQGSRLKAQGSRLK